MHYYNFKTFMAKSLSKWTTWMGISMLIFGLVYYKEINQLIENVLTSTELTGKVVDGIAALSGFLFTIYKHK